MIECIPINEMNNYEKKKKPLPNDIFGIGLEVSVTSHGRGVFKRLLKSLEKE